jgi:hypothetical protein
MLKGEPIRVDFSFTDKPHERTPGVYMGRRYNSKLCFSHPLQWEFVRDDGEYESSDVLFD